MINTVSMQKLNLSILIVVVAITSIVIGNVLPNVLVFAQTNQTKSTTTSAASNKNAPIISDINKAIDNIKKGDDKTARKQLLSVEKVLEDMPSASGAEKHIEASLDALKAGDNNGAIMHAQGAISELSK